jgi:ribonuclease P protein component
MRVAGRYQVVRRQDHAVPSVVPRPLLGREQPLDIRVWRWAEGLNPMPGSMEPMLLVNASRKQGKAFQRNRFRRRVRMAFLKILREHPGSDDLRYVVWVRPARGAAKGCPFSFHEIESQLRLALSRWETR